MHLTDFVEEFVRRNYTFESSVTHCLPGTNGLYLDKETPVRNTSHVMVLLARLYRERPTSAVLALLQRMADWLMDAEEYYTGNTYVFREGMEKDQCNGLIGPAWTVEGLLHGADVLERTDMVHRAESILQLHSYDYESGYWVDRVEPSGDRLSMDCTMNHQIWFAAAVSLLVARKDSPVLRSQLDNFLSKLNKNLVLCPSGRIFHIARGSLRVTKNLVRRGLRSGYFADMRKKELGYHAFNLLGLSIISKSLAMPDLMQSRVVRKALNFAATEDFASSMGRENPYACSYNPVGFECAVAFESTPHLFDRFMKLQFRETFDQNAFAFSGTSDVRTLNARLYELCYLESWLCEIQLS